MTTPYEPGRRKPFGEDAPPEAFYQTAEFRRAAGLMALLLLFGIVAYFVLTMHTADVAEKVRTKQNEETARAVLPTHPLTPEEREVRHTALLSKLEGALADTENGQPLLKQTPGYWKLLEVMSRYSPEEVAQRAQLDFAWDLVMKDPDAWRGEFVRSRGILQQMDAIRLERPVAGRSDVYRCILTDIVKMPNGEDEYVFWIVDMPDRPPGVREGDAVDVEGIVYRTVTTESREGKKNEDPLLIGRTMRRVPAAVDTGWRAYLRDHTLLLFALLAFLVFGSLLLFSAIRQGRKRTRSAAATSGSFQELFDKKLREAGKVPPPHD